MKRRSQFLSSLRNLLEESPHWRNPPKSLKSESTRQLLSSSPKSLNGNPKPRRDDTSFQYVLQHAGSTTDAAPQGAAAPLLGAAAPEATPTPSSPSQHLFSLVNRTMFAVALYDCAADDATELSFAAGDTITDVVPAEDPDWFYGTCRGVKGLFPGNYVRFSAETAVPPPFDVQTTPTPSSSSIAQAPRIPGATMASIPAGPTTVSSGQPSTAMQTALRKKNVVDVRQQMLSRSSELASNRRRATTADPVQPAIPPPNVSQGMSHVGVYTRPNVPSTGPAASINSSASTTNAASSRSFSAGARYQPQPHVPATPHRPADQRATPSVIERFAQRSQSGSSFPTSQIPPPSSSSSSYQVKTNTPPALPPREPESPESAPSYPTPQTTSHPATSVGAAVAAFHQQKQQQDNTKPVAKQALLKPNIAPKPAALTSKPAVPLPVRKPETSNPFAVSNLSNATITEFLRDFPPNSVQIDGTAARKLWLKSGLDHVSLGVIWEVVDVGKKGFLTKAEFIVGKWLISEALRDGFPARSAPENIWIAARKAS